MGTIHHFTPQSKVVQPSKALSSAEISDLIEANLTLRDLIVGRRKIVCAEHFIEAFKTLQNLEDYEDPETQELNHQRRQTRQSYERLRALMPELPSYENLPYF